MNLIVIREKLVMKNRAIDIARTEESVTESVIEIVKVIVTRIVNASARERRRVTVNQRLTEGVKWSPQMKKERIKTKLKNARVTLTRHRKQLVNDTSV